MSQMRVMLFSINKYGERTTPSYDDKNGQISVYGDSFSFCRLVNNDKTWPYYLSKIIDKKVSNFGVGNFV